MQPENTPYQYISDIIKSIKYKNRFFLDPEFDKIIEGYANERSNIKSYKENTVLYRSRIYVENDQFEKFHNPPRKRFQGYDEKNSFINLKFDNLVEGRNNPPYISYLYTSEDELTSIIEVKPYANTLVSVAKIKVLKTIKVIDFSKNFNEANDIWTAELYYFLNDQFNKPTYANGDYLLCQYISEKIKLLGFDGVRYRSAYSKLTDLGTKHYNITIFNYDKCKAISSKLHLINKVTIDHSPLKP